MTCQYCASEVPEGALFCGECGRSLDAAAVAPAVVEDAAARSALPSMRTPVPASVPKPAVSASVPRQAVPEHMPIQAVPASEAWPFDSVVSPESVGPEPVSPESVLPAASDPAEEYPVENPTAPQSEPEGTVASAGARVTPDPFPWGTSTPDEGDVEATRIVSQHGGGERFVLQFSTGESVTVSGAGLIGRNPAAQPGEYVDQLVSIFDVGKSVSKTHLEFGQDQGRFWVSDRYSTNGSIVRQPEAEPRRCEPGRRYFVVRGTRIDVGEQFFVVS
ncbi:MAG TPA: FHA domain-containing protein [Pseudolysinimonas sp.]|nr:FHA domain-containing protein [Pseudolysinimonas sp.]